MYLILYIEQHIELHIILKYIEVIERCRNSGAKAVASSFSSASNAKNVEAVRPPSAARNQSVNLQTKIRHIYSK